YLAALRSGFSLARWRDPLIFPVARFESVGVMGKDISQVNPRTSRAIAGFLSRNALANPMSGQTQGQLRGQMARMIGVSSIADAVPLSVRNSTPTHQPPQLGAFLPTFIQLVRQIREELEGNLSRLLTLNASRRE